MIQTNELRINNYVQFDELSDLEGVHQVQTITYTTDPDRRNIELFSNYVGNRQDQLFGIPLTPEILEKCGFKLFPWGYVKISSKEFGVRLNLRTFSYDVSGNGGVQLKYLHQLQNLFYALTGEELIIKL